MKFITNLRRALELLKACKKGRHVWDKSSDTAQKKHFLICHGEAIVKRRARKELEKS